MDRLFRRLLFGACGYVERVDMIQGDEECWEKSWVTNDQS